MDSRDIVKLDFDKPCLAWYPVLGGGMPSTAEQPISDLANKLGSAGDVDGMIRIALADVITRYRADAAILLTIAGSFEATCWAGTFATLPELLIPGLPAKIEENDWTGRALKSGQIQVAQEPGLMMKEQTVLVLPIKSGEQIAGVLRLGGARLNTKDTALISMLETIAGCVAENVMRLQSPIIPEHSSPVEVETPAPTTAPAMVSVSSDVSALYERVYRGVAGLMICDRFSVALFNSNKTWELVYQVENGVQLPTAPVSFEMEMIAYVARQRNGVIVADRGREMRFKIWRDKDLLDLRSIVCVPLIANGSVLGAMSVSSSRTKSYSDVDLKILSVFADLMVMVILSKNTVAGA
jgi:transcriptional regulator with GAF, ATPase, and Fis domain